VARAIDPKIDECAYWRVVEDCLVELYGMSRSAAESEVVEARARLDTLPPDFDRGFITHLEEIHQAAGLAGQDLPPEVYGPTYDAILERHYPVLRGWKQKQSTPA
jgi:hypothetical protein